MNKLKEVTSAAQFVATYAVELQRYLKMLDCEACEIFYQLLVDAYKRDAGIFMFGNGGSGAAASHFTCDLNKGVSYSKGKRFRAMCLNDNVPTLSAYANDVSYDDVFAEQLKNFLRPGDVVIGVSGSGKSENVLRAIRYAREQDAYTVGICGFGGGLLKECVHHAVVLPGDDMQKIEDMQNILFHAAMQWLLQVLP